MSTIKILCNQLDVNQLRLAEQHLRQCDTRMQALIERTGPCQLRPSSENPFWTLIGSIISQQLSTKAADTIKGRLLALVPKKDADSLLRCSFEQLRGVGLSQAKVRYVQTLADATQTGAIQWASLMQQSDEEIVKTMMQYPGIGRWTVDMFMIFALGRPDVLAIGDLGLKRGAQILYGLGAYPKTDEFRTLAEPWRPWRSVASWYLWRLRD